MAQVGEQKKVPSGAVDEFKALYFDRFGTRLSDEEATEKASTLLNLYRMVYSSRGNRDEGSVGGARKERAGEGPTSLGEERT